MPSFIEGKLETEAKGAVSFRFRVIRYKYVSTRRESMEISCFVVGADKAEYQNGTIKTDIVSIGSDIKNFMEFGVLLSGLDFQRLAECIRETYLKLKIDPIDLEQDERKIELFEEVKTFCEGSEHYADNDYYYIPVKEYNSFVEECGYDEYEARELREELAGQYVKTNGNRFAMLKRIADKPQRVVAFHKTNLDAALQGTTQQEREEEDHGETGDKAKES